MRVLCIFPLVTRTRPFLFASLICGSPASEGEEAGGFVRFWKDWGPSNGPKEPCNSGVGVALHLAGGHLRLRLCVVAPPSSSPLTIT